MLSRYATFTSSAPLNLTYNLCQFLNSSKAPQLIAFLDLQAAKVDLIKTCTQLTCSNILL